MASSSAFPTGVVTLMFTGIEGAAQFWEKFHHDFYPTLEQHNAIMRAAIEGAGGHVVKIEGDIFMVAFARAGDAIHAAVEAQRGLISAQWPALAGPITVAIGLHTGEPIVGTHPDGATDYFGPPVNRAARVAAAAHGGQIVISDATRAAAVGQLSGDFTFVDLGSHLLKGVDSAEKLFQVSHAALPAREFPPPNTLSAVRHNVPKALTTFIGRRAELDALIARIVQGVANPLTISGTSGIGKTRLAQQFATEIAKDFVDGAWYVDLAQSTTAERIAEAVAAVFSLRPQPQQKPIEQLALFLRGKDLLLILDHAPQLPAEILETTKATEIQVMITSEESSAASESIFVLGPLSLPTTDDLDAVKQSESAMLLEDRAKDASTVFEISTENAAAVAELVRKLNGMPQLIELAAARMRAMSPVQLLDRLNRGMNLLASRPGASLELKVKPAKP